MQSSQESIVSALRPESRDSSSKDWMNRSHDTNEELKQIMQSMQLKIDDVMRLSMTSYDTVKSWRVKRESKRWRRMPNRALAHLKMSIGVNRK